MRFTTVAPRSGRVGNQDVRMDRRRMLTLTTMLVAFPAGSMVAQQLPDNQMVKAASKAFYSALSVLDDGSAMEKVWARTPCTQDSSSAFFGSHPSRSRYATSRKVDFSARSWIG